MIWYGKQTVRRSLVKSSLWGIWMQYKYGDCSFWHGSKETFLMSRCSYTSKWKWVPHLFFKLSHSQHAWMDGILNSPSSLCDLEQKTRCTPNMPDCIACRSQISYFQGNMKATWRQHEKQLSESNITQWWKCLYNLAAPWLHTESCLTKWGFNQVTLSLAAGSLYQTLTFMSDANICVFMFKHGEKKLPVRWKVAHSSCLWPLLSNTEI